MKQDLTQVDVEGDSGYYIYCDIKPIRPEIIDKSDDFPLLLSPMNIQPEQISELSRKLLEDKNMKIPLKNTKLAAHNCGVKNYLITLPLLQFLITQGVEIEKVHKVIKFKQGFFLKNFIDENIRMRAAATNPFIKNALKLINNDIYGRTLLNPLNYATMQIILTCLNLLANLLFGKWIRLTINRRSPIGQILSPMPKLSARARQSEKKSF